jgi:predicted DNA-binding protein
MTTAHRDPESGKFVERSDSLTRKPINVRVTKPDRERLDKVVQAEGRTESDIVREAIAQWLDHYEKKKVKP